MRTLYENCPLCGGLNQPLLEADCTRHALYQSKLPKTIQWLICSDCKHVYTDGYWTPDALNLIFSKTHDNQRVGHDMELGRYVSSEIVEKVIKGGKERGRWLDVGFGNGALMFTAAEYGFEASGLDLRPDNVEAMKETGFNAHCSDITDFNDDQFYDIISMADCLEHMPYPKKGLAAARDLILRGGVLFLSMPNLSAPLWDYLNKTKANPYWGEIEHFHNFSKERLYDLLRETRFSPISYGVSKRYRACMEVVARAA